MTCERCGAALVIGMHPFCPHGMVRGGVIDDELPEGARWIENLGDEPVWIETKTQLRQELQARGLEPMVRHVDGDQHVSRWVSVDLTDYDHPDVRRQRQQEMAAWAGLSLDEFLAMRETSRAEASDPLQMPVIERYTRVSDETFTVRMER